MSRTRSIPNIVSLLLHLFVSLYKIEINGGRGDEEPQQEYPSQ